jgi:hypothetical protein
MRFFLSSGVHKSLITRPLSAAGGYPFFVTLSLCHWLSQLKIFPSPAKLSFFFAQENEPCSAGRVGSEMGVNRGRTQQHWKHLRRGDNEIIRWKSSNLRIIELMLVKSFFTLFFFTFSSFLYTGCLRSSSCIANFLNTVDQAQILESVFQCRLILSTDLPTLLLKYHVLFRIFKNIFLEYARPKTSFVRNICFHDNYTLHSYWNSWNMK